MSAARRVAEVEVVADRTAECGPDEGFLRLKRLLLRNRYEDGGRSRTYACDLVSRRSVDAVAVLLYERGPSGRVRVALREGLRPPVWLRRGKPELPFPDDPPVGLLAEVVAGVLEEEDARLPRERALRRRARLEALEEVGLEVPEEAIRPLGAASFPSPGVTDEKVYFTAAEVALDGARNPEGDGSVMEEAGGLLILDLGEALTRCRDGRIPDMKTEIALARLAAELGLQP